MTLNQNPEQKARDNIDNLLNQVGWVAQLARTRFAEGRVKTLVLELSEVDQTITTSLHQAETLRQSILEKYFSGQLVPQDPIDEPASVLLVRIVVN